jgi:hypothetical protein
MKSIKKARNHIKKAMAKAMAMTPEIEMKATKEIKEVAPVPSLVVEKRKPTVYIEQPPLVMTLHAAVSKRIVGLRTQIEMTAQAKEAVLRQIDIEYGAQLQSLDAMVEAHNNQIKEYALLELERDNIFTPGEFVIDATCTTLTMQRPPAKIQDSNPVK